MMPIGKSKFCVLTPKHSGRPYLRIHITIAASAVPIMLPFPPVDNVPPKTTAVIMDKVNVEPKLYFAESTFAVNKTPAIAAPTAVSM